MELWGPEEVRLLRGEKVCPWEVAVVVVVSARVACELLVLMSIVDGRLLAGDTEEIVGGVVGVLGL